MSEDSKNIFSCVGMVALLFVAPIALVFINGFVLSKLWLWLVSPVFGLPALTIFQASGISLVVSMLTAKTSYNGPDTRETGEKITHLVAGVILWPAIVLLIGWILSGMI